MVPYSMKQQNLTSNYKSIKMNVRNLKQLFEQKGTIKPVVANLESSNQSIKPIVVQHPPAQKSTEEKIIMKQQASSNSTLNKSFFQQLNKKIDNKHNHPIETKTERASYIGHPSNSTIANKNFLQQLNKKLDTKTTNNTETRAGGLSFLEVESNNSINTKNFTQQPIKKLDIKNVNTTETRSEGLNYLEAPSINTPANKNFLQQLNKKLDNKGNNNMEARIGGFSYTTSISKTNEKKKKESQITLEDIITGVDIKRQKDKGLKVRYGINESNPRQSERQIFGELNSMEASNDANSFSDLLQKMLKNFNVDFKNERETANHEPRKSKIVNKYEYSQQKLTTQQKVKRISFVLNVVFGQKEFQHISSKKQQPNRSTSAYATNQKPITQPIVQEQPKNISLEINSQNRTTPQNSSVPSERMKSVNNMFLSELSLKIQKKQPAIDLNIQLQPISQKLAEQPLIDHKIDPPAEKNQAPLTPRQKKKERRHQNFDEL